MAVISFITAFLSILVITAGFDYPAGVDVWCGKAYRPTNESFNPGGWLNEPSLSSIPLLDLRIRPRMSLYTSDDDAASFIVDAGISYTNGQPYYNIMNNGNHVSTAAVLLIKITIADMSVDLISSGTISVNTTSNEFSFSLAKIQPQFQSYPVVLTAVLRGGSQSYSAETQLFRLPPRTDGGSITKIDNLYGGLLVQDYTTNSTAWTPLLPYSYYVMWDGWLELSLSNVDAFQAAGYNIIHIVPSGGLVPNNAFNFTALAPFLARCDQLGLWVMYDMRYTYKNLSSVSWQVNMLQSHPSLLLWYTGDEPDGTTDPLNATTLAYNTIKSLDPYHPVSLCLNCYNFYFEDYTAGADIILEDVYPIAVNTSYSTVYNTVCNTTYGCCGCDDCAGSFTDISTRLEAFAQYNSWLGRAPKALWGVPQSFGYEAFWTQNPTAEEEVMMDLISINHNAKGLVAWEYPPDSELADATSALSKVLTAPSVTGFILGTPTVPLSVKGTASAGVDAASWTVGNSMLVSILYLEYTDTSTNAEVSVLLPAKAKATAVKQVLWGSGGWDVSADGRQLVKSGLGALEADLLIVDLVAIAMA